MLLGALMVLAPGASAAGGNPPTECATVLASLIEDEIVPAGTTYLAGAKWEWAEPKGPQVDQPPTEDDGLGGTASWSSSGSSVDVSFTGTTHAVDAAVVSQAGSYEDVHFFDPAATSGSFSSETDDLSHFTLCAFTIPTTTPSADLTIVKQVDEDPVPATVFDFLFQPGEGQQAFDLADGESEEFSALTPGAYTVRELAETGFAVQGIACFTGYGTEGVAPFAGAQVSGADVTVTLADEDDVTCVYTNEAVTTTVVIPPVVIDDVVERASLTVVKEIAGPQAARPDSWSFDFDLDGAGVSNTTLTDVDPSDTTGGLAPGEYVIREFGEDTETLALSDIVCVEDDDEAASAFDVSGDLRDGVTVTLDEGSDVTCTFVNTYSVVDVLPEPPVTPPVVAPPVETPPAVAPVAAPQVLGAQTVRALPRTGDESKGLAGAGVLLVALGAALVLGSKRQLAQR